MSAEGSPTASVGRPAGSAEGSPTASPGQPAGSASEIAEAQASLRKTPRDVELDALIESIDLRASFGERSEEIIDQWRKTRIEAARGLERASAQTGRVPGLAAPSPQYTPDPSLMQGQFVYVFATWLDKLTDKGSSWLDGLNARGGSGEAQQTRGGTEEGPTTKTTTVLDETFRVSASGSRPTMFMRWVYHTKTVDKATGATVLEADEDRTMTGAIDVCPTEAGLVPASLDSVIEHVAAKNGGAQTNLIFKTNSTFSGHVSDQAKLDNVDQEIKTSVSFPSGIVTGALSSSGGKSSATFGGTASGQGLAVLELGQASLMAGADGLDPYEEAENLWRHGRCVVVQAYGVETPVRVAEQEMAAHREEAAVGQEAKFDVTLRHRFGGGTLNQPVEATLATGAGELDPTRVDAPPGKISYTAVSQGEARARLQSTSNRGIGTLVLVFETKPAKWTGTITSVTTSQTSHSTQGEGGASSSLRTETSKFEFQITEPEEDTQDSAGTYRSNGSSSYNMQSNSTSYNTRNCGGEGIRRLTTTTKGSASGSASGEGRIMIAISEDGQYRIMANANYGMAIQGEDSTEEESGCRAVLVRRVSPIDIPATFGSGGSAQAVGTVDQANPNVLKGEKKESGESPTSKYETVVTWNLKRD